MALDTRAGDTLPASTFELPAPTVKVTPAATVLLTASSIDWQLPVHWILMLATAGSTSVVPHPVNATDYARQQTGGVAIEHAHGLKVRTLGYAEG